jgi:multimeric flavodoxin WrbA
MITKVVAVVGSYRKGGTIDTAVEEILAGAREKGAETVTFYLADKHIEFCTNCRECMQAPGEARGKCKQHDDLEPMLEAIDEADAVVLGSPVNCFNVTAIFRRLMERLVGSAYWPWGQNVPKGRTKKLSKKAVLVASSAAPGVFIPIVTGRDAGLLHQPRLLRVRQDPHPRDRGEPRRLGGAGRAATRPHPRARRRSARRSCSSSPWASSRWASARCSLIAPRFWPAHPARSPRPFSPGAGGGLLQPASALAALQPHRGRWAARLVWPIRLLLWLMTPITVFVRFFFSVASLAEEQATPEEETAVDVEALLEAGEEEGILEESDRDLVRSAVEFGDKLVREVMTPRPEVFAVPRPSPWKRSSNSCASTTSPACRSTPAPSTTSPASPSPTTCCKSPTRGPHPHRGQHPAPGGLRPRDQARLRAAARDAARKAAHAHRHRRVRRRLRPGHHRGSAGSRSSATSATSTRETPIEEPQREPGGVWLVPGSFPVDQLPTSSASGRA